MERGKYIKAYSSSFFIFLSFHVMEYMKESLTKIETKIAQILTSQSLECCYDWEWYTWHYVLSSKTPVVACALVMPENQIVEIIFAFPFSGFHFRWMYYIILKRRCPDFILNSLFTSLERQSLLWPQWGAKGLVICLMSVGAEEYSFKKLAIWS